MKSVNDRFITFYESLLERNIIKNAADFAKKIDISTSLMTEIMKKRSNVGIKTIQSTVSVFELNVDWLFTGKGQMLKLPGLMSEDEIKLHDKEVDAGKWRHSAMMDKEFSVEEHNKTIIAALQKEINDLKSRLADYSDRIAEQKETINSQRDLIALLKKHPNKSSCDYDSKSK